MSVPHEPQIQRALLSVSDKTGITELAAALDTAGVEIVSTGGTAAAIRAAGIDVTDVSDVTGAPEMLDGRVKTLHPNIHAAILARRDDRAHMETLDRSGLEPFDLVVVNLYRLEATSIDAETTLDDALEQIDIGGVALLRAAAKNPSGPLVVVDPEDYSVVIEHAARLAAVDHDTRLALSARAFRHTAAYDTAIADYLADMAGEQLPATLTLAYDRHDELRYGENPHQQAAVYRPRRAISREADIPGATIVAGGALSYNNLLDADAALGLVAEFRDPAAVAVKHAAPCGAGTDPELPAALAACRSADPVSIFGGVVAVNRLLDKDAAAELVDTFLEVIVAPAFTSEAIELLHNRRPTLRLLETGPSTEPAIPAGMSASAADTGGGAATAVRTEPRVATWAATSTLEVRTIAGGLLVQEHDQRKLSPAEVQVASNRAPDAAELDAMLLAWAVARHTRSNGIVLARGGSTVGIGGGQPNRVDAARIAIHRAGPRAGGAVLASDGFIPMPDTVEVAAAAGITAIIQPGGSKQDAAVIAAANEHDLAMVMTGVRHFRH